MELGEHEQNEPPVADCDCRRCAVATRDALRKDAERYRWLRDDGDGPANAIAAAVAEGDNEHGGEYVSWLYGDELDAAIDAAMKGANTQYTPLPRCNET